MERQNLVPLVPFKKGLKITLELRTFEDQEGCADDISVNSDDEVPLTCNLSNRYLVKIKKVKIPIPSTYAELQAFFSSKFSEDGLFVCERLTDGTVLSPYDKELNFTPGEVLIFREFQPRSRKIELERNKKAINWENNIYFSKSCQL